MEDKLYELLTKPDEVTWQTIIQDLVKTEELDPWNLDITHLAHRYRKTLETMKEHHLFISGKMVLALAILLKIKSDKLLNEHIADFDNQLFPPEEESLLDEEGAFVDTIIPDDQIPPLLIKTPQPRKRQLTLNDLMGALEKALEVDVRRTVKRIQDDVVIREAVIPEKKIDITELITDMYDKIKQFFSTKDRVFFDDLLSTKTKEEKIYTFIPLLHLDSQQKIDLQQDKPFGSIRINPYN